MNIRILLVDGNTMMREGLRSLLENTDGVEVVGEAWNGIEGVALSEKVGAHVVVVDTDLPQLNGIETARQIVRNNPQRKVVALSNDQHEHIVRAMFVAGSSAYVLKGSSYQDLLKAIQSVVAGKHYLSPEVASSFLHEYKEMNDDAAHAFSLLTDREREILQLIAEGNTTKEIAYSLHRSVKTIETHRRNIMEKLNLHSVAGLTKYAIREGISSLSV